MRYIVLFLFLGVTLLYSFYEKKKIDALENTTATNTDTFLAQFPASYELKSLEGEKVGEKILFGTKKKVLLHFWATWCAPCEAEFPPLVRLANNLKEGYEVYFVAINDEVPKIKKFIKRFGDRLNHNNILLDNSEAYRSLLGVKKVPETFLFGEDGKVIRRFAGPQEWDRSYYLDYLKSL